MKAPMSFDMALQCRSGPSIEHRGTIVNLVGEKSRKEEGLEAWNISTFIRTEKQKYLILATHF
jgi:hypothetical protein